MVASSPPSAGKRFPAPTLGRRRRVGLTANATPLIYAALGALAGAIFDKLPATYLMLFLVMTDLGIVQNPMFGSSIPGRWAPLLPGYGPVRMMIDGAFSPTFHASAELIGSLGWLAALALAVYLVLRRAVRTDAGTNVIPNAALAAEAGS